MPEFQRRHLEALCALAELSAERWADALAALGPASEGTPPNVIEQRLRSAAPTLAVYAGGLLGWAVEAGVLSWGAPARETAELRAAELWAHLGGSQAAVLRDRLHALLTAPWVVQRAPLRGSAKAARRVGPIPIVRMHETSRALLLVAELAAAEWDGALSVLERSADAPPREVYALVAGAAPTLGLGYAHRLLFDVVYGPHGCAARPGRPRTDALVSTFAGELDADRRLLLLSRLEALISTTWIAGRLELAPDR
jgi:hypothetical protein